MTTWEVFNAKIIKLIEKEFIPKHCILDVEFHQMGFMHGQEWRSISVDESSILFWTKLKVNSKYYSSGYSYDPFRIVYNHKTNAIRRITKAEFDIINNKNV